MPPGIKSENRNNRVWELRESLESAHTFVRQNTGLSIHRQKRYHDGKTNYEKLEVNDKVYVLFPVKRIGQTIKFCSFLRGPFQIKEKLCDVLYIVDCGRNGTHQVIHIDRIKKAKSQTLTDDTEDNHLPNVNIPSKIDLQTEVVNSPEIEEEEEEDIAEQGSYSKYGRQRHKPIWLQDYVSSIFRENMPNLKITPRKRDICLVCKLTIQGESFGDHMAKCVEKHHQCSYCGIICSKPQHLKQHIKRKHSELGDQKEEQCQKNVKKDSLKCLKKNSSDDKKDKDEADEKKVDKTDMDSASSTDDESDVWHPDSDPEIHLDEFEEPDERKVVDIRAGRMFRKPTQPPPVLAPVKKPAVSATITSAEVYLGPTCATPDTVKETKLSLTQEVLDKDKVNNRVPQAKHKKQSEFEIDFSVKGDGKTVQKLGLVKNGESLFTSTSINMGNICAGHMNFTLEDFLGPGVISVHDVNINVDKECLKIQIKKDM